ncbi:MAG: 4-hydroxythreonine-4-phosphate dehydrogenase PdxA [Candidatus Omnitrophota bacterium]|jgi:4-hydroxythreonine-4-phosphate dehydrogenase
MRKENIVITIGDPAGCGPVITLEAVKKLGLGFADFIIVGDRQVLEKIPLYHNIKNKITLIDPKTRGVEKIKKGYASALSGMASSNYLRIALDFMKENSIKRLVTAPLSKEAVKLNLPDFSGHSEYLAAYFNRKIEMMMVSDKVKTVLFSRHIPLRNVSSYIKEKNLIDTFSLVENGLQRMFKIKNPKVVIASLNPHAGRNTFLDKEEKIICSAIKGFGAKIFGPYPADTIFVGKNLKKYDCVICLYHDQAMTAFKLLSIKDGVNLTIGLPIIRTSPAHGVAYDIMRENKTPFSSSMVEAIKLSARLNI